MNIVQIFEKFPTQQDCIGHLERKRWGSTPLCPYCGSDQTAKSAHRRRCYACKTSFSVTVGTIFSPHPPSASELAIILMDERPRFSFPEI